MRDGGGATAESASDLGAILTSSDLRYFELGARVERIAGLRVAWMQGLEATLAGCVVLDADGLREARDIEAALDAVEARVTGLGGRVRLYLRDGAPVVEAAMRVRGYASREETGFVVREAFEAPCPIALEPVEDDAGWELKLALHQRSADSPDGHEIAPERRVELERRKSRGGDMRVWLIRAGGAVAGTFCTLENLAILRLKNLLVDRERRRRGIATSALSALFAMAERGDRVLGLFAVTDSAEAGLYRRPEIVPVTHWVEWLGPQPEAPR